MQNLFEIKDWFGETQNVSLEINQYMNNDNIYIGLSLPDEEDEFYASTDCGSGNWKDGSNIERIKDALASKCADHWWEYIFSVKISRKRKIIRLLGIKFTIKNFNFLFIFCLLF